MSQSSDKMIAKLNGQTTSGEEGSLNDFGGGIKKSWNVRLEDLSADVATDIVHSGFHIEDFTVKGKWTSHVRKDEYAAHVRINKHWGDNKNPYGDFSIKAQALNGGITTNANVTVDNYNDEANIYAREKAEALIRSILNSLINN